MSQDPPAEDSVGGAAMLDQVERDLRDGQRLLASVLDNLPLGVGVYDRDGHLTLSNRCLRAYGSLDRLPSRQPAGKRRWRACDGDGGLIPPGDDPGSRALRGERVMPGTDFLYDPGDAPERWMRISAVPFRRDGGDAGEAIVVVQDVDDLKRAGERIEGAAGVSRDASERRGFEEEIKRNEARLRAAIELAGLGIYAWDPVTGALDWDDRLRAMWGLPPDAPVDMTVYEAGIHPEDLPRVRDAIAACIAPAGDGRYAIEYRVIGRADGILRHIATSGRTSFTHGRPTAFIGAAIDVSEQRRNEAAVRSSEAQFRSFAENSSNLLWIADPAADAIVYRSAAFERIWGVAGDQMPVAIATWMQDVHPDDRSGVARSLDLVKAGEVAQYEYRIVRPSDGGVRWLRDTSFPIRDHSGAITRIGGIAEDLTHDDSRQVYIVSARPSEARRLARLVRAADCRARTFEGAAAFLDIAPVLAPGCVLVDLRKARDAGLSIPRELKARSIALPTVALDEPGAGAEAAVAAMKSGAIDYVVVDEDTALRDKLAAALAECHPAASPSARDEGVNAQIGRLTSREREVLVGLVDGGTNKVIAQSLGISPRTVELHRAQVMSKLGAGSLTELGQIALAVGLSASKVAAKVRRTT
jgi:PAS domain S-box-containing protein